MKKVAFGVLFCMCGLILSCGGRSPQEKQRIQGLSICENVEVGDLISVSGGYSPAVGTTDKAVAIVLKRSANCFKLSENPMIVRDIYTLPYYKDAEKMRFVQSVEHVESSWGIVHRNSPQYEKILITRKVCGVTNEPIQLIPCKFSQGDERR